MKRCNFPGMKKARQEAAVKRQEERANQAAKQQLKRLDDCRFTAAWN